MLSVVSLGVVCDAREEVCVDGPTRFPLLAVFRRLGAIFRRTRPSPYRPGQRVRNEVDGLQPVTRHFSLSEFADLSDGRRVILKKDRSFGGSSHIVRFAGETGHELEGSCDPGSSAEHSVGISSIDPWRYTTRASLTQSVLAAVEPDDDQEWFEWVVERLRSLDIEVDPASVCTAPYQVEFGDSLLQKLLP